MRIGATHNGWTLKSVAYAGVEPPQLYTGSYVEVAPGGKAADGSNLPALLTRYRKLHRGRRSLYVSPAGVAKDASGVEIKERK
jgi:hypothetical protein